MGRRRWEHGHEGFEDMNNNCHNRNRGGNSFIGLIFAIVSFAITLAFKIVEIVFQSLFGVLSGISSNSRNRQAVRNVEAKADAAPDNTSYTINDIKQKPAAEKRQEESRNSASDNVREFKKPESSKTKAEASATTNEGHKNEEKNKDFYVVLFILTIIPAIVALAMGKLLYAGAIGAAGIILIIMTGIISGIAGSFKKKAEEKESEEDACEVKEEDSVEKLIKEAFEKLFEIRKDIDKISDTEVRAKMEAICHTGEKIIGEVRTNPEGLKHVRKFFYYYLDAFGEIVNKYLKLSTFEGSSEEVRKLIVETEKTFADIDGIFKELCEKLLEKDMMNLKAEINVMKNSN